ncbi:hypothetical protein Mycch_5157 [Mycolicibacterium chubuense NBB4]|uniref:Secreted protein n=1 Tax=Mycolicibacterium chubuense (strain NBB4) TaxID=710421 RepID=I4BRD6_MYCCN|nr:hypothetical protein [Mycolicibacterium chubuense]AFM19843.1 hypothetical protein Mycch_5157 [Mycolicibacterium chubuense NBB4]
MSSRGVAVALALPVTWAGVAVAVAAPAGAECVSSAGTTVCSQGTVRGSNTGQGPGTLDTGPAWPYPCDTDWLCGNDGGLSIVWNPGRR